MRINTMAWPGPEAISTMAQGPAMTKCFAQLDLRFESFIQATLELSMIPAPTFSEGDRADWVERQMTVIGLADVRQTSEHNVVGRIPGEEPGLVIAAHTDTVFGLEQPLEFIRERDRLVGPGIGDNSIGVSAMLEVARVLHEPGGTRRAIWFAATSGEEGLGDLIGARALVNSLGDRIGCFLAIEGHFLGRVCNVGVGSRRWRIAMSGSGGHSWHDYGTPSAVNGISDLAVRLAALSMPVAPRSTLNVASIHGGEGINIIARAAALEIDLRSESQGQLDSLTAHVDRLNKEVAACHGLDLDVSILGDRPAYALQAIHPLVTAGLAALHAVGVEPRLDQASTDANLPGSFAIPSIAIGVTRGSGMHTPHEWVEEKPARQGLRQLALLAGALTGGG